jgi:hypothetical protein
MRFNPYLGEQFPTRTFIPLASVTSGFIAFYWLTWSAIATLHPVTQTLAYGVWGMNLGIFAVTSTWLSIMVGSFVHAKSRSVRGIPTRQQTRWIWMAVGLMAAVLFLLVGKTYVHRLLEIGEPVRIYFRYLLAVGVLIALTVAISIWRAKPSKLEKESKPDRPLQIGIAWLIVLTSICVCIAAVSAEPKLTAIKLIVGGGYLSAPWTVLLIGYVASMYGGEYRQAAYHWAITFFLALTLTLVLTALTIDNSYGVSSIGVLWLAFFLWPPQIIFNLLLRPLLQDGEPQTRTAKQMAMDATVIAACLICFGYSIAHGGLEALWRSLQHLV